MDRQVGSEKCRPKLKKQSNSNAAGANAGTSKSAAAAATAATATAAAAAATVTTVTPKISSSSSSSCSSSAVGNASLTTERLSRNNWRHSLATTQQLLTPSKSSAQQQCNSKQQQQQQQQQQQRRTSTLATRLSKSFRIVTCVLVSFLLANMPWQVVENMIATGTTDVKKTDSLYILFWIMSYMNAFLNPIFYCFMNTDYKNAVVRFVCCSGGVQRRRSSGQQNNRRQAFSSFSQLNVAERGSALLDNSSQSDGNQQNNRLTAANPAKRRNTLGVCAIDSNFRVRNM